jgi:tRNA(Ile2) C34 agmatinyltransferase TiaS
MKKLFMVSVKPKLCPHCGKSTEFHLDHVTSNGEYWKCNKCFEITKT